MPLKIEKMFAFVATDDEGNEGVCGFNVGGAGWMPMVGADMAMVEKLRPMALATAEKSGQRIKLVLFTNREEVEEIA